MEKILRGTYYLVILIYQSGQYFEINNNSTVIFNRVVHLLVMADCIIGLPVHLTSLHIMFFLVPVLNDTSTLQSNREFRETDINVVFYPLATTTIPDSNLTAGFDSYYLNDVVDWSYNGWDGRFGLLYKFFDFIRLGGSVKLPTTFVITEDHYLADKVIFQLAIQKHLIIQL